MLLRDVRDRLRVGLPENRDHLLFAESGLLHGSLCFLRAPFSQASVGPKITGQVNPKYKTKYHVQNWASYDRALVSRGDITIWLSPEAVATWEPDGAGTRGAQRKYSDVAIETALTLRLMFHLPLRQAEGLLTSLFVLMGLD